MTNLDELHIIRFRKRDFAIQHPLSEREEGFLFECKLHQYLYSLPASPVEVVGDYADRIATFEDHNWTFSPLPTNVAEHMPTPSDSA